MGNIWRGRGSAREMGKRLAPDLWPTIYLYGYINSLDQWLPLFSERESREREREIAEGATGHSAGLLTSSIILFSIIASLPLAGSPHSMALSLSLSLSRSLSPSLSPLSVVRRSIIH